MVRAWQNIGVYGEKLTILYRNKHLLTLFDWKGPNDQFLMFSISDVRALVYPPLPATTEYVRISHPSSGGSSLNRSCLFRNV